ncbi:hypothetical protein KDRO_E00160 [Kluyveromyces lactis]|nr:hypothetical protein KDRO_E00160 [Kluyveromyces lactis]
MVRGIKLTNNKIKYFLYQKGINICYTSTADFKAHGVAERQRLTLLNDRRMSLNSTNFPITLWYHAVELCTLLRNSAFNHFVGTSPLDRTHLVEISVEQHPFGQPVILHVHDPTSKLEPCGVLSYALHPSKESCGYVIYVPETEKIVILATMLYFDTHQVKKLQTRTYLLLVMNYINTKSQIERQCKQYSRKWRKNCWRDIHGTLFPPLTTF